MNETENKRGGDLAVAEMIAGVGFYFNPVNGSPPMPTFQDLRRLVEERAHRKWERSGAQHGRDWDYWFQAEAELFCGFSGDGYDTYVCDLSKHENKGMLRYWDRVHVGPECVRKI